MLNNKNHRTQRGTMITLYRFISRIEQASGWALGIPNWMLQAANNQTNRIGGAKGFLSGNMLPINICRWMPPTFSEMGERLASPNVHCHHSQRRSKKQPQQRLRAFTRPSSWRGALSRRRCLNRQRDKLGEKNSQPSERERYPQRVGQKGQQNRET